LYNFSLVILKIEIFFFDYDYIVFPPSLRPYAPQLYMDNANLALALNEIIAQSSNSCVTRLAEKYGFDPAEATAFIASGGGETAGKKSKSKSKAKMKVHESSSDDAKPKSSAKKRNPTGYMLYCKASRPEIVAANNSLKPQEIISQLARDWKALDSDDRIKWNTQAKELAELSNSGSE